ncbi:hypothetical protein C0J52_07517 [Blattella germanica]|nr:hypothetical protein C0J52_07517 [Blattella germanica]
MGAWWSMIPALPSRPQDRRYQEMGKRKKTGNDQPSTPPGTGGESPQRGNPETPTGIISATSSPPTITTSPSSPPSACPATSSAVAGSTVQQTLNSNPASKTADSTTTGTPPQQQQSPVLGAIVSVPPEGIKAQPSDQTVKPQLGNIGDNLVPKSDVSKADKLPQVQVPSSAVIVKEIQEKLAMPKPVSPSPVQPEQKVLDSKTIDNINKPTVAMPQGPMNTKTDTEVNKNTPPSQMPIQLPASNQGDKGPVSEKSTPSQIQNPKVTTEAAKDSNNQKTPPTSPLQSTTTKAPPIANISSPIPDTSKPQSLGDKKGLPKIESEKQSPVPSVKSPEKVPSDKPNPEQKIPQSNVANSPSIDSQILAAGNKDPLLQKEKTLQNQNTKPVAENKPQVSSQKPVIAENKPQVSPQKPVIAEKPNPPKMAVDKKKSESPQRDKPSQIPVPLEKNPPEKNSTNKTVPQSQANKESDKVNTTKLPVTLEGTTALSSLKEVTENKPSVPINSDKKEVTSQPAATDLTKSQNEKPPSFSPPQKQVVVQKSAEVEKSAEKPTVPESPQKSKDIKPPPSNTAEPRPPTQQQIGKAPIKPVVETPAAQSDSKPDSYSEKVNKSIKSSASNQTSAENKEIEKSKGENKISAAAPPKNDKTEKKEPDQKPAEVTSPPKDGRSTPVPAGKGAQPKVPLSQGADISKKDGTKAQVQGMKGNKAEEKAANPRPETPKPMREASTAANPHRNVTSSKPRPETPKPKTEASAANPRPETPKPKTETSTAANPRPETPKPKTEASAANPSPETAKPKTETSTPANSRPETPKPKTETSKPKTETPKPKTEASTASNEVPLKKENAGPTKKSVPDKTPDTAQKKSDSLPRKSEPNNTSTNQNTGKGKEATTAQSGNTSKPPNENESSAQPKSEAPQGSTQKVQKQPEVLGEVKIDDANNKDKGKTPENKTPPKKPPTATKNKPEEAVQKSGPAASNEPQDASKKAKAKKPKQKGGSDTDATKGASTATKENQPIAAVESGNKDVSKATAGGKSQETSNLLGLVQEVIEGIEKQGSGSSAAPASTEKGTESKGAEEAAKKSKRSRNKKKSKAKEGQDSQEKGDNQDALKQGDAAKTSKSAGEANAGKEEQKKKPEESRTGDLGKSGTKSKKEKGKKEGTSQSGDKPKQAPPRSKTNQSSAVDISNVSTDQKSEGGTAATDSKEVQEGQGGDQPKKKRKRRKNKGKQTTNEEGKEVGEGTENIAPTSEATNGIKKNSNESKVTEKIASNSGNETLKKTSNKKNFETKIFEPKPSILPKLSEEQLTHITRTAVNLSQSLGDDPDKINLKFTPDLMQSLLAPKPTDIVSSTEDEGEIEYRLVQRQIFLSYVCHVCKSLDSKTCSLKKCNSCKLISYCSKKHQKDHWSAHKDMCTAITAICKRDNLSHLFEKAKGLSPNDFRLYRTHFVNMCAQELGRNLQLWEKEMIYYPQVCHSCYESDMQKLINCQNCNHVSYCNAQHRKADHDIWCKQFLVYRDITLHQFHNGMIKPIIPDKVFQEHVPLSGDMTSFLSKAYEITENSVQMSKLHFVVLTEVATCPFTVLYSLDICGFPLKDAEVLTVHLVGAEVYFEIDTIRKWELLLLHLVPKLKVFKLVFVGPELNIDKALMKSFIETKVCQACKTAGRKVSYEFWPGFYHDFVGSKNYGKPDLICAFNSGLYRPSDYQGMDSWSPTIEAMFRSSGVPVVVTEYTDQELPLDIARVRNINNSIDIIMPPTRNPFSSSKPSLNFLSEEKVPVIFKNFYITVMRRT